VNVVDSSGWLEYFANAALALHAAEASVHLRLPMADSVILATAQRHQATLWTQDADFQHVPGVLYRSK